MTTIPTSAGRDTKVIGLVSFGHMLSHFYFLVLAPILTLLKDDLDVGYAALGLLMTGYALAAGIAQTPMGFFVDRFGGRPSLAIGMGLQGMLIALMGLDAAGYWQLLALFTLAGLANTVYHPADYAILTASVHESRIGRAFSVHLFSGNFGWAITPGIMVGLTALWGWRWALVAVGLVGVVFSLYVWTQSRVLDDDMEMRRARLAERRRKREAGAKEQNTDDIWSGIRLLFTLPIMMGFLFFAFMTFGFSGLRAFFVAAMDLLYATPIETSNSVLSGFLLFSAIGILAGGMLVDRWGARTSLALVTLVASAGLVMLMGLTEFPFMVLIAVFSLAGFLQGLLLPARDLLIRSVTPEGSMGKVMGFMSSATMLASAVVPLLFGWILDTADPNWMFWISAVFILGALVSFITAHERSSAAAKFGD